MRRFLVLAVVSLSACAAADLKADQCAAPYEVGFRDAIMGLNPQDNLYGAACNRNGAPLNLAAYREGWLEGHFQYENRTPHTE
ncbi:MAG TPA: hypothetical protein VNU64_11715 [Burkholderiales bacterium]|nr:hypothetical protein [Burkholderiales bacterium]